MNSPRSPASSHSVVSTDQFVFSAEFAKLGLLFKTKQHPQPLLHGLAFHLDAGRFQSGLNGCVVDDDFRAHGYMHRRNPHILDPVETPRSLRQNDAEHPDPQR